jgi:hypothetical protein
MDLDKLTEKLSDYITHPDDLIGRYVLRIHDGMRLILAITAVTKQGVKLRSVDTRIIFRYKTGINIYQNNFYATQTDICYLLTAAEVEQIAVEIPASNKHASLVRDVRDIHFGELSDDVLQQVIYLCKK